MTDLHSIPNIVASICGRRVDIGKPSLQTLAEKLTEHDFPRRHLLIREGEMSGMAYFIESGMARCYWIVDGEEITTSFATEGGMAFSMDEVYYNRSSEEYIETMEPMKAFSIPVETLLSIVNTDITMARWWCAIHQDEYRRLHRSHKERLTLPAAERYREFAIQFPEVARRARLTDIASYLGISLSTLSRVRASIS